MRQIEKIVIFISVFFYILSCSKEDGGVKSDILSENIDCSFGGSDAIYSLAFLKKKGVKKISNIKAGVYPVGKEPNITDIPLLNSLVLREANISGRELLHLRTLVNLKELDISWNKDISDSYIPYLPCLQGLEKLSLVGTNISDNALFFVSRLQSLRLLSLPSTITVKGLSNLKGLKSLKSLSLFHKVSEDDFSILKDFPSLSILSLSGAVIDNEAVRYIKALKGLKRLILPQNISRDTIAFISRELPSCKVIVVFNQSSVSNKEVSGNSL